MTTDPTTQEPIRLSRCPFCGKNPILYNAGKFTQCDTQGCGIRGALMAVTDWNTRATQPESEDGKRLDWLESCEEIPTRDIYGRDYRTAIPMQAYLNRKAIDAAMHSTESKGA